MIPRDSRKGTPLAPDQIFSAGFRDGMNRRAPHPQFQTNLHYLNGYIEGCRSIPDTPPMIPFCHMPTLDAALQSIATWDVDRERFGFGRVALSYTSDGWAVLVSKDLHDAALPF